MAVIRTKKLAAATLHTAGTWIDLYTVPQGSRATVREIWWQSSHTGSPGLFWLALQDSGAQTNLFLEARVPEDVLAHQLVLASVMNEGDKLLANVTTPPLAFWISGVELPPGES